MWRVFHSAFVLVASKPCRVFDINTYCSLLQATALARCKGADEAPYASTLDLPYRTRSTYFNAPQFSRAATRLALGAHQL